MLIIAMPKSASSSLARTLARANGLIERNDELNAGNPPQFSDRHRLAQHFHPFPAVPTPELRRIVEDPTSLHKLHLFPTTPVLEAIDGARVIVLLRDPMDVIDAEFRAYISGIHPRTPTMPRTASLGRWRSAAVTGGLLQSLEEFVMGWREVATGNDDLLTVTHEMVVREPDATLERCGRHLGLPTVRVALLQERWSGQVAPRERLDPALGALHSYAYVATTIARRIRRRARRYAMSLRGGPARTA